MNIEELAKQHGVSTSELEVALAKVLALTPTKVQDYFLVTDPSGFFETVIAERDVIHSSTEITSDYDVISVITSDSDVITQALTDSLQSWYSLHTSPSDDFVKRCTVRKLTHNEWVDWVRS